MEEWKNVRPEWCPHLDCEHIISTQEMICKGKLLIPEPHDEDTNTHRLCIDTRETGHGIFDLKINKGDIWHLCRILQEVNPKERS